MRRNSAKPSRLPLDQAAEKLNTVAVWFDVALKSPGYQNRERG